MKFESERESGELLNRISRSEETAFRQFFDVYYRKLFHVAFYFLKSKELAEEAVADVFYFIWRKRAHLPAIKDLDSYLYISVKNRALHYLRHHSFQKGDLAELYTLEYIPDPDNPERTLLDEEYKKLIQNAIDSLPAKCKEVFRLAFSSKMKHKDIAVLLDISGKTVEAHITKAYREIGLYVRRAYETKEKISRLFAGFF